MRRTALILFAVPALAASASAQSKFAGSAKILKPEKEYKIDVGDRPGHVFLINQVKCIYTKGEIAGIQVKEEMDTGFYQINGNAAPGRFSGFVNVADGDKIYLRGESTLTLKDGVPQTDRGTWSFNGGTGKFKSLKGKGTYKVDLAPDGSGTLDVAGEYEAGK